MGPRGTRIATASWIAAPASGRGLSLAELFQFAAEPGREVEQRAQRARGEQAVAGTPGPAGVGQHVLKLLHQRRLAGAGLPGEEHEPAVTAAGLRRVVEQRGQG
ncbi:MAG: hypothetical protein ABSB76_15755 [Streptosporangiaceae bacterium]